MEKIDSDGSTDSTAASKSKAIKSALIFLGTGCSSAVPNVMCLLQPSDPPCKVCEQALSIPPEKNPNYRPSTENRSWPRICGSPPRTCSSKRMKKSSASVSRATLSGDLNKAIDIMRMTENQVSHERKLYQAVKNMEQVKRRGVTFQGKVILYLLDSKIDKMFVEFETDEEKWEWLKHLESDAD